MVIARFKEILFKIMRDDRYQRNASHQMRFYEILENRMNSASIPTVTCDL